MPAHIKENFYRCPNCGNAYFTPRHEMVLRKDPDFMYPEDFELNEAVVIKTRYRYICTKCGQELDRNKITKESKETES